MESEATASGKPVGRFKSSHTHIANQVAGQLPYTFHKDGRLIGGYTVAETETMLADLESREAYWSADELRVNGNFVSKLDHKMNHNVTPENVERLREIMTSLRRTFGEDQVRLQAGRGPHGAVRFYTQSRSRDAITGKQGRWRYLMDLDDLVKIAQENGA